MSIKIAILIGFLLLSCIVSFADPKDNTGKPVENLLAATATATTEKPEAGVPAANVSVPKPAEKLADPTVTTEKPAVSVPVANVPVPKPAEKLADPTVTTEKPAVSLLAPKKPDGSDKAIPDPTHMNENFRSALDRLYENKAPAGVAAATPAAIPITAHFDKIKLVAIACGHSKEKNHAMLMINGKSEMVSVGDKIHFLVEGQRKEIEVLDIEKNHVHLKSASTNELIILR